MKSKLLAVALAIVFSGTQAIGSEKVVTSDKGQPEFKALPAADIAGLLSGEGMGYAKSAELNGYPGPAHVLELAEKLQLTPEQETRSQIVFDEMQKAAQALGAELVAAEVELEQQFRDKTIDKTSLSEQVEKIGRIESRLRTVHLEAHLQQTQLLSGQQIDKYMMIRHYRRSQHDGNHPHEDE